MEMVLRGKKVVVTGVAGLVGSRLAARLLAAENTVIGVDNFFSGSRDAVPLGVDLREGHTKDIKKLVPETDIDVIFHLGEYARVEQSLEEPDVVYDLNKIGTQGVVEWWRGLNASRQTKLVYAGSSTKFGDGGLARDATPYAWTKATNTELVRNYGEWYKLPYAVTYFYNVYGPGERSGKYGTVIQIFKDQYLRGEPITVTSPGTQRRNFTHVDDIVDGLILVAEKGEGDNYGLGNEKTFSLIELARLFGTEVVILPERAGNRMDAELDTVKSREVGWEAKRKLEDDLFLFLKEHPKGAVKNSNRILVFTTTFFPAAGPAEVALLKLVEQIPDLQFDVITTAIGGELPKNLPANMQVHRVGMGWVTDKYVLPFLGAMKARVLLKEHSYLFIWSLMASYAGFAGTITRRFSGLPLLITLADQTLQHSPLAQIFSKNILASADQVYGMAHDQEKTAARLSEQVRTSIGAGDALANQIRFTYHEILRK